ncbi:GNAT family N-acetyltransferase [Nocardia sp. NPDC051750]|uniref:GNAT family N-acetyltransferase n=1 Tax=Nocardia sp. NPDC051750 TaxID=3364325 RepID=UPI0037A067C5
MSTSVTGLTLENISRLPAHARRCVFWEIDPAVAADSCGFSDPVFEKEAWISTVMLEWGSCGQLATIDEKTVGCALYAPPRVVPRSGLFPTSPVSPDAILLTTLGTEYPDLDGDIAYRMVQAVVTDLVRRGVRALEAFGIRSPSGSTALSDRPTGTMRLMERIGVPARGARRSVLDCSPENCMIDADFLQEVGFEVVAPHHRFPRLRLELDTDHGWKEDVERALDQLLAAASMTVPTRILTL